MNKLVNRRLFAVIVISCLIAISSFSLNKVAGKDYSVTLEYGEYFYATSDRLIGIEGFVDWSFSGSNNFVGIEVLIMDEVNYWLFYYDNPIATGYTESDGSYYDDFGSFDFPIDDYWYIVFLHNDLTAMFQSTTLDITVDFVYGYLGFGILLAIIITPIVVVIGIIILIVVIVIRRKKKPIQP